MTFRSSCIVIKLHSATVKKFWHSRCTVEQKCTYGRYRFTICEEVFVLSRVDDSKEVIIPLVEEYGDECLAYISLKQWFQTLIS